MSKGNPIVQIRLTAETISRIESIIHLSNMRRKDAPYDLSSWIRHAIKEKLDKLARSKKAPSSAE